MDILDKNQAMIQEKLQIEITQADKDTLVAEMQDSCTAYNEGVVRYYNTGIGRFWNRLQLNLWFMLGELVLLVVILVRWCVLFCSGRGRAAHGIRAFAITLLVPSGIYTLGGVGGYVAAKYLFQELPVLADITSGASAPLLMFGGIGVLAAVFMLILASMILSLTKKPAEEPEILSEIPTAAPECAEAPVQESVPVAAGVSDEPAPLSAASETPPGEALTSTVSEEESPAEMQHLQKKQLRHRRLPLYSARNAERRFSSPACRNFALSAERSWIHNDEKSPASEDAGLFICFII